MTIQQANQLVAADNTIYRRAFLNCRPAALELRTAQILYDHQPTDENERRFVIAAQAWQQWKQDNPDAEELKG